MTNEQFQQLIALLGQIGKQAYDIAVRQAKIEAATSFLWMLLALVGVWLSYKGVAFGVKWFRSKHEKWDDMETPALVGMVVGCMALPICAVLAVSDLVNVIQYALNPQWQALLELSKLVK